MKSGSSIFLYILTFLIGSLTCYVLLQFSYLNIVNEVRVIDSILAVSTIIVGLYIAVSIKKRYQRSQGLHLYVQTKFDKTWGKLSSLQDSLSSNDCIKLKCVIKPIKLIFQETSTLKTIFTSFEINTQCLDELEQEIDNLNNYLTSELPVKENIIDYSDPQANGVLKEHLSMVNQRFVATLVQINKIL